MSSIRIISYNVNGIRAAINKGLINWLKTNPADIVCLQETKAQKDNVAHQEFTDLGFCAKKRVQRCRCLFQNKT